MTRGAYTTVSGYGIVEVGLACLLGELSSPSCDGSCHPRPVMGGGSPMELTPGMIISGPFWAEPVRVLAVQALGADRVRIEAVQVLS